MKKLFDIVMYAITLPITLVVVLFKSSENDRGVSYNADQGIKDSAKAMNSTKSWFNLIDTETTKIVASK